MRVVGDTLHHQYPGASRILAPLLDREEGPLVEAVAVEILRPGRQQDGLGPGRGEQRQLEVASLGVAHRGVHLDVFQVEHRGAGLAAIHLKAADTRKWQENRPQE